MDVFKRIIAHLWGMRIQVGKYLVVGITSFGLDILTLIFFTQTLGYPPVVSVMFNQLIVIVYHFLMSKYWSFTSPVMLHKAFVRYCALLAFNYFVAILLMYILHNRFGIDYRLVRLMSVVASVTWNFYLFRYWVFYGHR